MAVLRAPYYSLLCVLFSYGPWLSKVCSECHAISTVLIISNSCINKISRKLNIPKFKVREKRGGGRKELGLSEPQNLFLFLQLEKWGQHSLSLSLTHTCSHACANTHTRMLKYTCPHPSYIHKIILETPPNHRSITCPSKLGDRGHRQQTQQLCFFSLCG